MLEEAQRLPRESGDCQQQEALIDGRGILETPPPRAILAESMSQNVSLKRHVPKQPFNPVSAQRKRDSS